MRSFFSLAWIGALLCLLPEAWSGLLIEPVSVAPAGLRESGSARGDSYVLSVTPDGAWVLFLSTADNLVTRDHNAPRLDLFLKHRVRDTVMLISVNAAGTRGGNGHTTDGRVTPDGRYVVFQSEADDLVSEDHNGCSDIFLRDTVAAVTTLVSVELGGVGSANGPSLAPSITPDGRFVAFVSAATNLVAGDANRIADVFVRDIQAGVTTLASVGARSAAQPPYAWVGAPVLTPDGRFVAFSTTAVGLVPTAGATGQQVYVRDLAQSNTTWASRNVVPASTALSCAPVLSDDGRYVTFKTTTDRNPRPWLRSFSLFRRDLQTQQLDLISTNAAGIGTTLPDCYGPVMTPDGRFVAFTTALSSSNSSTVLLWDARAQTPTLVSADRLGQASAGLCDSPSVSPDGRFVLFLSNGGDLVTNQVNGEFQVYVRDVQAGVTALASANPSGAAAGRVELAAAFAETGRLVAFDNPSDSLVAGDQNLASDVFACDLDLLVPELVSAADPLRPGMTGRRTSAISPGSLSADGRVVAFESWAGDLVAGDTNGLQDVFVRDRVAGTNGLVSVNPLGMAVRDGASRSPALSADGRRIVFLSTSAELVTNDTNRFADVFLRDLESGVTELVSVSTNGLSGNGPATAACLSADGRRVAFQSRASNLVPGDTDDSDDIFVRDRVSGTTTRVSADLPGDSARTVFSAPLVGADGRFVAFQSYGFPANTLRAADLEEGSVTVLGTNATGYAFSGDGHVLAAVCSVVSSGLRELVIADLPWKTRFALALGPEGTSSRQVVALDREGRCVAFASRDALVNPDTNGVEDVFVYERDPAKLELISRRHEGDGTGKGRSYGPRLTSGGRFVVFRSAASDLVAGDSNGVEDVFVFDRATAQTTLITWGMDGVASGNGPSAGFTLATEASVVALTSAAGDLVEGDFNGLGDVWAASFAPFTATDSDRDGLDDAWEMRFFGDLTHDGREDSDADGLTDGQEFRAGTDPGESASCLKLDSVMVGSEGVRLGWTAAAGRFYRLEYKASVNDPGWQDSGASMTLNGGEASATDAGGVGSPTRFYRLRLFE